MALDQLRRKRIRDVRKRLGEMEADALLSMSAANIFYLCGFTGSSGALCIHPTGVRLFTDGRYAAQSRQEVTSARIQIARGSLIAGVGLFLKRIDVRRLAVEVQSLTMGQLGELRKHLGTQIRIMRSFGLVEELRQIKSHEEIVRIRKSAQLALAVVEATLKLVRPGLREMDLAAEIDFCMRRKGASGAAFETIVASGRRSALPHARPSLKKLKRNELVIFDVGAILDHYCCDLTRTVYLGRAPARLRRWYCSVWQAQQAARNVIRPGVPAGDVDSAARFVLEQAGLGRCFVHSTGHGLGLEVHENPRLALGQTKELQSGNVITIEPGIYVDGIGGIRIEDEFVILGNSGRALTTSPAELPEL